MTAITCAMNWMITWITISALMSTSRFNRHAAAEATPMKTTEKHGNCLVGCSRANAPKNRPSAAAA